MARRAGQVARCPWCAGSLRRGATECPDCLFPLTMAAVEGGGSPVRQGRGTSSTASPSPTPLPSRFHVPHQSLAPQERSHRLRVVSWLLGLTAALLLVAGVASWISVTSPDSRSDAAARFNLGVALSRARGDDKHPEQVVVQLPGDMASDASDRLSVLQADGMWFGAAQSASGSCFVLAWRLDGQGAPAMGSLGRGEPCSGAQARNRLGVQLGDAPSTKEP